jgi:hypothetical protein
MLTIIVFSPVFSNTVSVEGMNVWLMAWFTVYFGGWGRVGKKIALLVGGRFR